MARRVFFSFHYDDVKTFRANVVRKHDMLKTREEAGFFDASIWEDAKRHGDASVKRLINNSLQNTSVTCVLIGTETWRRRWVRYEILKSYERGNKIFGVRINSVRDKDKKTLKAGRNPFSYLGFTISKSGFTRTFYEREGPEWEVYQDLPKTTGLEYAAKWCDRGYTLSKWVPISDWMADDGYENFADWVENA
jgi:MTH538 TIR-like domain (DUF1863)